MPRTSPPVPAALLTVNELAPQLLSDGTTVAVRFSSSFGVEKAILTIVGSDGSTVHRAVLGPGAVLPLPGQLQASIVTWDTARRTLTLRVTPLAG